MKLMILTGWDAYFGITLPLPLPPESVCWRAADLIMRLPGVDFAGCLVQGILA